MFVRVLYSILGSFAGSTIGFDSDGQKVVKHPDDALQKFVASTGNFGIYIVMSLLMEYIVVLLYTIVGVRTPLHKDEVNPTLEQDSVKFSCGFNLGLCLVF